ncbi:MAG: N-6 DNA methylase [Desulfobacterales bacterium]
MKTPEQETRLQVSVLGIEKKQLPHVLCITNMMLHGIETPSFILHDNALREGDKGITEKDRVDVILTNPPFGGQEEDGIETNFSIKSRETADLFLLLIIRLLKKGGRCGIVLPDGTLFGDGVKARIKEKLLEECRLHTIVRLPNGVAFNPYTGIKTNLLFFTKRGPTEEIWFYEHPYPEGYKSYSKTKPMQMEEFEPEKAWWNERTENEYAWKIDFKTLKQEALSKAKPHWTEADAHTKEAMRLEAEVRMIAKDIAELKKEDEKKNRKKIKALQDKQKQFQKVCGTVGGKGKNGTGGRGCVLAHLQSDLSIRHRAKTEKRDSEKMLKDYRELLQEITEIREQLKQELMNAIGGKSA